MIQYIKIKWYKCFEDFEIQFNPWINLLVWENDAWKSSILSVIRILKWELSIDKDDFREWANKIDFKIKINWNVYKYIKDNEWDEKVLILLNIKEVKEKLSSNTLNDEEITKYISILWWNTRLRWENKNLEIKRVLDLITEDIKEIEGIQKNILINEFLNIKYEDWKSFNKIQDNFKIFIKDDVNKIWDEEFDIIESWISVKKKLSELVSVKLKDIKSRKEREYKENLLPTIQEIIPSIQWMWIELNPNLGNFTSYESKVDFLQNWKSINIDKKWDWTRRRITLALFKQESLKIDEAKNIYLFDEPDTHLNLRVQQDLVNTFYKLVENWHQVIFTSHSPFILNLLNISNIILLQNDWEKTEKVNLNLEDLDDFNKTLYNLWIQNIDIFFSKYFLFYEWETELNFFSKVYYKKYWDSIEKKFIRQINCDWIDSEAIFLKNFCTIIWDWVQIISIVDKDYQEKIKTKKIIDGLKSKFTWNFKLIQLWTKEFEDEFSCEKLFNCFKVELVENWINSQEDLEIQKNITKKFSSALSKNIKLWKPEIWNRLANYFEFDDLSEDLKKVLEDLNSL
jgi:predicted ATP-dependent endonuclease of OLD family